MNRRKVLKWAAALFLSAIASIPLLSFWMAKRYRPPRQFRVSQRLKEGEYVVEGEFVLFVNKGTALAVSRKCTHLGCRLNFLDMERGFICPCHQSKFSWSGRYIEGPAKRDLQRFPVKPVEKGQGFMVYLPR